MTPAQSSIERRRAGNIRTGDEVEIPQPHGRQFVEVVDYERRGATTVWFLFRGERHWRAYRRSELVTVKPYQVAMIEPGQDDPNIDEYEKGV